MPSMMNRENITGIYSEGCLAVRHPGVILLIILLKAHKVNGLEKNMQTFTSTHHTPFYKEPRLKSLCQNGFTKKR